MQTQSRLDSMITALQAISTTDRPEDIGRFASVSMRQFVPFDGLISISRRSLLPGQYKVTRQYVRDVPILPPVNPWKQWKQLDTFTGGFLGEAIQGDRPRNFDNLYLRDDPMLGDTMIELGSCLALPLFDNGAALNWNFHFRYSPEGFNEDEIELMMLVANLMGQATRNMVTTRQVNELNRQISAQLDEIAQLQRSLLPVNLPRIHGAEIRAFYQPCEQAGGDHYDFAPLDLLPDGAHDPDGRWGIFIADVSGHGARAAVIMAMMQSILHAFKDLHGETTASVLKYLNEQLLDKRLDHSFITALAAAYNPATKRLQFSSAGHFPPRLKKPGADAPVIPLSVESGFPLGISPELELGISEVQLEAGDTLIFFTDGIIESFSPQREMFGLNGLDQTIYRCSGEPECVIDSIISALRRHEDGLPPADDQTILAMKIRA